MKKVVAGDGSDSTAAVLAWLKAGNVLWLKNLYLIGEVEDPMSFWLTDYEAPLSWPVWGVFQPAVISRGTVTSKIGLEVQKLDLTWSPLVDFQFTKSVSTASPYQLARIGYYDNWKVRVWTVYMPNPGDANTFGCSELYGGRIASSSVARGKIQLKINSFIDSVNQYVPLNTIELQNTTAGYKGAIVPAGQSRIPQFTVVTGDSVTQVNGQCTTSPGHIFDTNSLQHGYLVFNDSPTATLSGIWAAIQQNTKVTIAGTDYNQFIIFGTLPWSPTPGADTFYVSGAAPADANSGFPFVPSPTSGI